MYVHVRVCTLHLTIAKKFQALTLYTYVCHTFFSKEEALIHMSIPGEQHGCCISGLVSMMEVDLAQGEDTGDGGVCTRTLFLHLLIRLLFLFLLLFLFVQEGEVEGDDDNDGEPEHQNVANLPHLQIQYYRVYTPIHIYTYTYMYLPFSGAVWSLMIMRGLM